MRKMILQIVSALFLLTPAAAMAQLSRDSYLEIRYSTPEGEESLIVLDMWNEPSLRFNHGWIELNSGWMKNEQMMIPVGAKCSISFWDPAASVDKVEDGDGMPVFLRSGDALKVRLASSCRCEVYDLQGRMIMSEILEAGEHEIIHADSKGLFIVKAGDKSVKILK